ncbi:hypothetical protein RLIN73S_07446 [Rhodanobacter lindaniclasticus]
MSSRGSICLKCTLKPCANSSAAPGLMFGSINSRYSAGCTMSGVSTATRSAPFTASAGSSTVKPSARAFSEVGPFGRRPITTSRPESRRFSACARP